MTRMRDWRIRTKLVIIIIVMASVSLMLYRFLWVHQVDAADLLEQAGFVTWFDSEKFIGKVTEAAKDYSVPESEDDTEMQRAIDPFLDEFTDEYTGISIYGLEDGLYRYGRSPEILERFAFGSILSNSQIILGDIQGEYPVEFANGTYDLVYYSYSRSRFTYPYVAVSIILCVMVFLAGILIFVGRTMKRVSGIKDSIVRISSGDLTSPVPFGGGDEIGVVAAELDALRRTLAENIRRESESRQANQDLITAVSHDLRTPLTVLNGYLEVLRLKRADPEARAEYIDRCLKKAEDIRILTDRMFEYALVYEEDETAQLKRLPASVLADCVRENCDFIRIAGFTVNGDISRTDGVIYGDEVMIKRIFSNLFSNILKYGDKKGPVSVNICTEKGKIQASLSNRVKEGAGEIESTGIGLRSVRRMTELHRGKLYIFQAGGIYTVKIQMDLA
ncbi:MAG TPA: HAMP domain-containing histidine kinase [Candidatus Mediterraneibacter pullistercoris]|nr:HAMP domain-containing histidine kinase [Candidatus Mediterraneibacter pullistercoris]